MDIDYLSTLAPAVMIVVICIREVLGSNLKRDTDNCG
jgi:hypothetical protein